MHLRIIAGGDARHRQVQNLAARQAVAVHPQFAAAGGRLQHRVQLQLHALRQLAGQHAVRLVALVFGVALAVEGEGIATEGAGLRNNRLALGDVGGCNEVAQVVAAGRDASRRCIDLLPALTIADERLVGGQNKLDRLFGTRKKLQTRTPFIGAGSLAVGEVADDANGGCLIAFAAIARKGARDHGLLDVCHQVIARLPTGQLERIGQHVVRRRRAGAAQRQREAAGHQGDYQQGNRKQQCTRRFHGSTSFVSIEDFGFQAYRSPSLPRRRESTLHESWTPASAGMT